MSTESTTTTFLDEVKKALRITDNTFNSEIQLFMDAALSEMDMLGIDASQLVSIDPQIRQAVIFYVKARFGFNDDAERWQKLYIDVRDKLMIASAYKRGDE